MSRRPIYALLAPYLIGTAILVLIPAAITVGMSLTSYDAFSPPIWVALGNFEVIARYQAFTYAVRNTVAFLALAVPLRILAMVGMSLLLNQPRRGLGAYRVAIYLPTIIPDIVYALLWLWIFNPVYGPINAVLAGLGLPTPAWMVDRNTVGWILLIMSMFQIGEGIVVLLAGIRDIPEEYYQAAEADGGTRWQGFRHITFPLLRPWLVLLTFRDIAVSAQNIFTPAFIMMGGSRSYASWFLPQMLYEEAFIRFRFGIASAVMVTWLLIAGVMLLLTFRIVRGWGYANEL